MNFAPDLWVLSRTWELAKPIIMERPYQIFLGVIATASGSGYNPFVLISVCGLIHGPPHSSFDSEHVFWLGGPQPPCQGPISPPYSDPFVLPPCKKRKVREDPGCPSRQPGPTVPGPPTDGNHHRAQDPSNFFCFLQRIRNPPPTDHSMSARRDAFQILKGTSLTDPQAMNEHPRYPDRPISTAGDPWGLPRA